MRLICEFTFDGKLRLPINYNHILQGFIFNSLTDEALKDFIHDVGFRYEKRAYKLYTYSKIMGSYTLNRNDKTITFESPIKLHISSIVDDFVNNISTSFFKSNRLYLGSVDIELSSIKVGNSTIDKREAIIEFLSPVTQYSTFKIDGRNETKYYSPSDSVFSKQIRDNILRKYQACKDRLPKDTEFSIEYIGNKEPRKSVIKYKGTVIQGYNGKYKLEGNPELIRFAYNVGLGGKCSQGFGCFNIIK